jgi:hypothetical protein
MINVSHLPRGKLRARQSATRKKTPGAPPRGLSSKPLAEMQIRQFFMAPHSARLERFARSLIIVAGRLGFSDILAPALETDYKFNLYR